MDVARCDVEDLQIRSATPTDAEAILLAHLDSIHSLGPAFPKRLCTRGVRG